MYACIPQRSRDSEKHLSIMQLMEETYTALMLCLKDYKSPLNAPCFKPLKEYELLDLAVNCQIKKTRENVS